MKLSSKQKKLIVEAIEKAEHQTNGEIRVHLSYANAKNEPDIMAEAKNRFVKMEMHSTSDHNGMLLYVNPKIHQFALFGDEGIHQKVGQQFWDSLTQQIRETIREKDLTQGIIHAVEKMGASLKQYYPHTDDHKNELSNEISESD